MIIFRKEGIPMKIINLLPKSSRKKLLMELLKERSLLDMSVYFYNGSTTIKNKLFIEVSSDTPLEVEELVAIENIFDVLSDRYKLEQIPNIAAITIVEKLNCIHSSKVVRTGDRSFRVELGKYPCWD